MNIQPTTREVSLQSQRRPCVAFVALEFYPSTHGGAGILISQAARALLSDGFDVVLLLNIGSEEFKTLQLTDRFDFPNPDRLYIYHLQELTREAILPEGLEDEVYRVSIRIALALQILRKKHHLDFIEIYDYCGPGWHSYACPELTDVPIAVRLHSTIELIARRVREPLDPKRALHYHQERSQLRLADAILCPGERFFEDEVCNLYPFVDRDCALVSKPMLDKFPPRPPRADARNVLFYGRLSTLKGLDTFLRAIPIAMADPSFAAWVGRFVIVGPQETVATGLSLEEMLSVVPEALKARLQFLGRLTHNDLGKMLPDVAFAAFANKVESFCYAAHELHVSGTPLILPRLPAFRDHFEHDVTAKFFDGTAFDLAMAMVTLAADQERRASMSARGIKNATGYRVNCYQDHIRSIKPRRVSGGGEDIPVTALLFSQGDRLLEDLSTNHLNALGVETVLLRSRNKTGWSIAGSRFENDPQLTRTIAHTRPVGRAILGLRAGDIVDAEWLKRARQILARDDRIGSVAGWRLDAEGLRTAADHLLPELALGGRMGLRRLIRVPHGLMTSELFALMKNAGEVSLLLLQRTAGRALTELPAVAVDARFADETPCFDAAVALAAESDRLDQLVLGALPALSRQFVDETTPLKVNFASGELRQFADAAETGICQITTRPDEADGEVWLLRIFAREGSLRLPWNAVEFSDGWISHEDNDPLVNKVINGKGTARYVATDETTIDLLVGPICGACEIAFRGKRIIIKLQRPEYGQITIRLADLSPVIADPSSLNRSVEQLELQRFPSRTMEISNQLLLIASPGSWTARYMTGFQSIIMAPGSLGSTALAAAAAICRSVEERPDCAVAFEISSEKELSILEHLIELKLPRLTVILPADNISYNNMIGYAASVLVAAALSRLARRAKKLDVHIRIAAQDSGLKQLFEASGASFLVLPPQLLPVSWGRAEAPPSLAIVSHSQMTSSAATHLASAAIILRRRLGRQLRVFVSDADVQSQAVLREFRTGNVVLFRNLRSQPLQAIGPAVALSVHPDRIAPDDALASAALGFAPLVGPSGLGSLHLEQEIEQELSLFSIEYWEDSRTIADRAERLFSNWHNTCNAFTRIVNFSTVLAQAARAELCQPFGGAPERAP